MIAAWCFQCGLDYSQDVAECVECGVPTVHHPPPRPDVLGDDATHLAYELHGWVGEARAAVENRLHAANLARVWNGPTLLVREDDEDAVDAVIDEVDQTMTTDLTATRATEDGRIAFDLGTRSPALHADVSAALADADIDHEITGSGHLLVASQLEDPVQGIIDAAQEALRATHTFGPGVPGVESHTVVEALFVSADVLRRSPADTRHRRQLLDHEELARALALPFGYEAPLWRSVLDHAAELANLIDDGAPEEEVEAEAGALREVLLPYV